MHGIMGQVRGVKELSLSKKRIEALLKRQATAYQSKTKPGSMVNSKLTFKKEQTSQAFAKIGAPLVASDLEHEETRQDGASRLGVPMKKPHLAKNSNLCRICSSKMDQFSQMLS